MKIHMRQHVRDQKHSLLHFCAFSWEGSLESLLDAQILAARNLNLDLKLQEITKAIPLSRCQT